MRSPVRDERGFTMTEVLMTVIIMGMIAYPISMVLTHALTLMPQSGSRSAAAADRAFFVNTFSDDVANSTGADDVDNVTACVDYDLLPAQSDSSQTNLVTLVPYTGSDAVTYRVRVESPDGYEPNFADILTDKHLVTIERVVAAGASAEVVEVVLEGYCDGAVTIVNVTHTPVPPVSTGPRHQTVSMTLRLRDAPELPAQTVNLEAAMRKTG